MPIPDFDHNNVIPPFIGNDATEYGENSPYLCTSLELCERFATSEDRKQILLGFINFRLALRNFGFTNGFQILDGSFLENIETSEQRSPKDLDLLTIYWGYDISFQQNINNNFPAFFNPEMAKQDYLLDHYFLDMYIPSAIDQIFYWNQLFSHNRNLVWKGMLKIIVNTPEDDIKALNYLQV